MTAGHVLHRSTSSRPPVAVRGEGIFLIDTAGKRYIDACGGAHEAFQLLMLEHLDNMADTAAKAISNIKFDKVVVWENGLHNGQSNTASFLQNMAHTLPPMMQVMKEIGGLDIPDTLVKMRGTPIDTDRGPAAPAADGKGTAAKSAT